MNKENTYHSIKLYPKKIILLVLIFLGLAPAVFSQVSFNVVTDTMMIGDNNFLHFKVELPVDAKIIAIDLLPLDSIERVNQKSLTIGEEGVESVALEVRNYGKWKPGSNKRVDNPEWTIQASGQKQVLTNTLTYTVWEEGIYFIPSLYITYELQGGNRKGRSNVFPLVVLSPLTNTDEMTTDTLQVAPIKDIITEPLKLQDFIWGIIGLLAVIGFGILGYVLMKRKEQTEVIEKPVIIRPAHIVALEKLDELKNKKLWQQGEVKTYQSELTYIVREYLENRYDLNALESTTDEILQQVKKLQLPEEIQANMRETLTMADMVKFAKATPPVDVNDRLMQYAESFIIKTKKAVIETSVEETES